MKLLTIEDGFVVIPNLSFVSKLRELRKVDNKGVETLYYNFQLKSTYNSWTSLDYADKADAQKIHAAVLAELEPEPQ